VGGVHCLEVFAIYADGLDSTVVLPDEDLAVEDIKSRGVGVLT